MATWRAEVFVNSNVGRINTEVEAATFQGAKDQIYAKHGDVQQIVNLREVRSGGGSSSSDSTDLGGYLALGAFLFGIWLLVEYWWIVVPIAVILGILIIIGWNED
jgi:hypothetical protein